MPRYPEKLKNIIETINMFEDQSDRIGLLVEYAEKFNEVPERIASKPYNEKNRVEYCESEAYVWAEILPGNKCKFYFAVENPSGVSAKALASILEEGLSGESADTILNLDTDMIFDIFGRNISMGKNLGLTGIIRKLKQLVAEQKQSAGND